MSHADSPLDHERQKASFDVEAMGYLLGGGEERTKRMQEVRRYVEEDPVFDNSDRYTLDRLSQYKRGLQKNQHFLKRIRDLGLYDRDELEVFHHAIDVDFGGSLHWAMFVPTLMSQASDEQQSEWLPKALPMNFIGTYAQTELGHGTNVQGLETTATYDIDAKEFVIHSPTTTSTKWWPGGLGKTSTHCVLMARLIIRGKDYGIHAFFVQIRSLEDHHTLPGITLGDIGPKMGYEAVDNGFMRFEHHRIPLFNMLARNSQVSPDGVYTKPPHDKLSYGTMVFVRAMLIYIASSTLGRAVTIATRYSAVRKQGYVIGSDKKGAEMTVLDFGLQQSRLFPLLASSYALHFTGRRILEFYKEATNDIRKGNFEQLAELHATAAGLKAFSTWEVSAGIEECRKACGGHGYLRVSGLVHLFADYVPACTYEGDNYVLIQQTVKYLFKLCEGVRNGEAITVASVAYLVEEENTQLHHRDQKDVDWYNSDVQLYLFRMRAKVLVWEAYDEYTRLLQTGKSAEEVWNAIQHMFPRMIHAHCMLYIARCFTEGVAGVAEEYPGLVPILRRLSNFYILHNMQADMIDFVENGMISRAQRVEVRKAVQALISEIRPDAVPLVDSFHFSDHRLNSALGRYDGRVYEALLESAKRSTLNRADVVDGYEQFIQPLIKGTLFPESRL